MRIFSHVQAHLSSDMVGTLAGGEDLQSKVTFLLDSYAEKVGVLMSKKIDICIQNENIIVTGSWNDMSNVREFLTTCCHPQTSTLKQICGNTDGCQLKDDIHILSLSSYDQQLPPPLHVQLSEPVENILDGLSADDIAQGRGRAVEESSKPIDTPCKFEEPAEKITEGDEDDNEVSKKLIESCAESFSDTYRKRRKSKFPSRVSYAEDDDDDDEADFDPLDSLCPSPEGRNISRSKHVQRISGRRRGRPRKTKSDRNEPSNFASDPSMEACDQEQTVDATIKRKRGRPRLYPSGFQRPKKPYAPKYEECYCPECDFKTTNRKNLAEHIKGNHQEKIYSCPRCDKKFSTKNRLNMHVKYHTSRGSFQCEICGRNLSSKTALEIHVHKKHDGPRPKAFPKGILCTHCGKLCLNGGDYEVHVNKEHDKVKPYICDLCGKSYHGKIGLQSHQREVHQTEYHLQCPTCGKMFKRKNNLEAHKAIHAEERPYKCDVCDKRFTQNGALIRHMRVHTGERPFKCYLCGSQFNAYSILRRHLQGVHKIVDTEQIRETIRKCKEMFQEEPSMKFPAGEETPNENPLPSREAPLQSTALPVASQEPGVEQSTEAMGQRPDANQSLAYAMGGQYDIYQQYTNVPPLGNAPQP